MTNPNEKTVLNQDENEKSEITSDSSKGKSSNEPSEYILVAEDSLPNSRIIVLLLEKLGFGTIACTNGDVAWAELLHNENKNIVAVLSDIMMPKVDGLELLKRVRASEKYANIPFVLITGVSDRESIITSKNLKTSGYILKPIATERLISKMKELFPHKIFPKFA